jgi:hypothetical protein
MNERLKQLPWKAIAVGALLVAEVAVLSLIAWSASSGPMFGLAVRGNAASIEMPDQRNVVHTINVDRVVSPVDGWLIVQADWDDGVPDAILGSVFVPAGEHRNITIDLDPLSPLPHSIYVTLLADMGTPRLLEYSVAMKPGMEKMRGMGSTLGTGTVGAAAATLDKPVIAGGNVVSAHVNLSAMSFAVGSGAASLSEATRTVEATSVVIPHVVAPAQSWLSVSAETSSGQLGDLLGATLVPSGEQTGVVVVLSAPAGRRPIVATLHVDLGTVGQFDYSPLDLGNSIDQPYVAGGRMVSVPIRIKR